MNFENKSILKKTLISQTWNHHLARAIVHAVEEDLRQPKPKPGKSLLQLAIEKEKGNNKAPKSLHGVDENADE